MRAASSKAKGFGLLLILLSVLPCRSVPAPSAPRDNNSRRMNKQASGISTTPKGQDFQKAKESLVQHTAHQRHTLPSPGGLSRWVKKGKEILGSLGHPLAPVSRGPSDLQTAGQPAQRQTGSSGTNPACPGRKLCQSCCPTLGPRVNSRGPLSTTSRSYQGSQSPYTSEWDSHSKFWHLPAGQYFKQQSAHSSYSISSAKPLLRSMKLIIIK